MRSVVVPGGGPDCHVFSLTNCTGGVRSWKDCGSSRASPGTAWFLAMQRAKSGTQGWIHRKHVIWQPGALEAITALQGSGQGDDQPLLLSALLSWASSFISMQNRKS